MERFEVLEKKIRLAVGQIQVLRQEKQKLLEELTALRESGQAAKSLVEENEALKDQKKTVSNRIEKLLKKLNSLKI